MDLRPYQAEAKQAIFNEWNKGVVKTLLVCATGTGKTVILAKVVEDLVKKGEKVLILAHRGELLDQASDKIYQATGLRTALEKAEATSIGEWERIVVGSVQTLMREKRLNKFKPTNFDTIIIDEAHHCVSDSYQNILNYFNQAKVLGVTATPDRGDMKNLGTVFESLAYEYSLAQAIRQGYLAPIKALTIPLKIDLNKASIQSGDFKASDVDNALEPLLEQIADEMLEHCLKRKTVVFLPLIKTSQKFRDILNSKGFKAQEVNGESKDRAIILKDFEEGKYNVLCNSMLLTEGWDCPSVDCIIMLRPTKIRSLYCQVVGRGTRLHKGKDHLLLLDFLWHSDKHSLCRPVSLINTDDKVIKKSSEKASNEEAKDIQELEQEAKQELLNERELALAKELEEMRKKKKKLVDPLQFELSIQDSDLASYEPSFLWEMAPASAKQLSLLESFGIAYDAIENCGKASLILEKLEKRKQAHLSTPKQIRFLEARGFKHVGTWDFEEAKKMINRFAVNNWQVPKGITPASYVPKTHVKNDE